MDLNEIIENFDLLDDWDDRYRYLIELGRELEPLEPEAHDDEHKVRGCASQVWLTTAVHRDGPEPHLTFKGDSDAHIVRGLITLVLALYSGKTSREIMGLDAQPVFEKLGLASHLTPQRSNGVRAMVDRIKGDARAAQAT